jgi:hypothetical protein
MSDKSMTSLSTGAARNLATETKSAPQMAGITPRWLLKVLPWVPRSRAASTGSTGGGAYALGRAWWLHPCGPRCPGDPAGAGRAALARRVRRRRGPGGARRSLRPARACRRRHDRRGRAAGRSPDPARPRQGEEDWRLGKYGDEPSSWASWRTATTSATAPSGDGPSGRGPSRSRPLTACTVLTLSRQAVLRRGGAVQRRWRLTSRRSRNARRGRRTRHGSGRDRAVRGAPGEPTLPGTFVDYELPPPRVRAERRADDPAGAHPRRRPLQRTR